MWLFEDFLIGIIRKTQKSEVRVVFQGSLLNVMQALEKVTHPSLDIVA
jgi:hypothetical protein